MFGQAQLNVPVLGLVENMSYFTPKELPENKYYIFGKDGGKRLADEYDLPFLGQIPLVQSIREGGDQGVPVMMGDDDITKKAFQEFASTVVRSSYAQCKYESRKNCCNCIILIPINYVFISIL
jgi:ATP-binding protein involved in chromosome partitioning